MTRPEITKITPFITYHPLNPGGFFALPTFNKKAPNAIVNIEPNKTINEFIAFLLIGPKN